MGLFSREPDPYQSSDNSDECGHPNMSQHDETDSRGNVKTVAYCPSCGMEWG